MSRNRTRAALAVAGLFWVVVVRAESLVGRVVDASGGAIEGAQVCASSIYVSASGAKATPVCATSGADGTVSLSQLAAGSQQVSVRAPRHAAIEGERVDQPSAKAQTWVLSPAGTLIARLADPTERGVAGAKVVLKDRLRGTSIQATTDSGGGLRVDGLAAGYWRIEIEPAEHRTVVRDNVTIEPGGTTDLGILHARGGSFIEGRIVDATGAGIAGAEVRVQDSTGSKRLLRATATDDEGRFRVAGLRASSPVDLLVHPKKGFAARSFEQIVPPRSSGVFALDGSVKLAGRAVVESGSLPRGSRVVVWPRPGHSSFDANAGQAMSAEVDLATGAFEVEGVPPGGEVEARLYAPGLGEATATVVVDGGKAAGPIELRPKQSGIVLRGRVQDRSGRPIAGARLGAAVSDAEGRFAVEGLQPGDNRIVVMHPQYAPTTQVFPRSGEGESLVVLDEGGTVEGTVTDPEGRPLVGVRIAGDAPGVFATTGAGGRFRLDHLPPGDGGVERQSVGGAGDVERHKVTIAAGEKRTVDFRLPGGSLEGAIRRAGEPVTGAALSVHQAPEPAKKGERPGEFLMQSSASDDEGGYRAVSLRPGVAKLVVNDGKQSTQLPVTIDESGASRLDVELPPYALEGVVLDAAGAPVTGACVASGLSSERIANGGKDADAFTRTTTDRSGKFLLYTDESQPEVVTVCTCAQGCQDVNVDAAAGGTATLWFAPVGKADAEGDRPDR